MKTLIFDWGDTIMRDFMLPGMMKDWEHVEYTPGAEMMLMRVSPHFTCVIATSANHSGTPEMIASLERVGAQQYFQHFISSRELGCAKPDPEFFRKIMELLNKMPPDCFSIGNLYEKDIAPAKLAGMKTIWYNEKKQTGSFPLADHIIHHWDELPAILKLPV